MKVYGSSDGAMPLLMLSDEASVILLPEGYEELRQVAEVQPHSRREFAEKSETKSKARKAKVIVIGGAAFPPKADEPKAQKPLQEKVQRTERAAEAAADVPAKKNVIGGQGEQALVIDNGSGMVRAAKPEVAGQDAAADDEAASAAKAAAAYACWSDGNAGRYCCQFGGSVDSIACWHDRVHMD